MDYSNKESLKPLLASMGMLGVATITSAFSGPLGAGAYGLAGKVVCDLVSNLAPNIASDQILKINPQKLRQYFTSGVPNLSNHDLYKGFRNAIKLGLDATVDNYKNSLSEEEYEKYHIGAIVKKIMLLKNSIDDNFDEVFLNTVSDEQILTFVENENENLSEQINTFLNIEGLSTHGYKFLPFVKKVLPSQILAAFTEILKKDSSVWIAYQRLILTDIQTISKNTNIISRELLGKVDVLSSQLEMIQRKMDSEKEISSSEIEQLWILFREAKDYHEMSIGKLDKFHQELTSKLNDIHFDLKNEITKAGIERQLIITNSKISNKLGEETIQISRQHYEEFQVFIKQTEEANKQLNALLEKNTVMLEYNLNNLNNQHQKKYEYMEFESLIIEFKKLELKVEKIDLELNQLRSLKENYESKPKKDYMPVLLEFKQQLNEFKIGIPSKFRNMEDIQIYQRLQDKLVIYYANNKFRLDKGCFNEIEKSYKLLEELALKRNTDPEWIQNNLEESQLQYKNYLEGFDYFVKTLENAINNSYEKFTQWQYEP